MHSVKTVPVNRYLYASGRIRALEIQMLDSGKLSRLQESHSTEDVSRILAECGYPAATDPETRLGLEMVAVYRLMQSLFPEPAYMETLLFFHDFHNLKVILKSLTPAWPRRQSAEDTAFTGELPEPAGPYSLVGPATLDPMFRQPSLVDPHLLYTAVRDRQPGLVPAWIYEAAVQAAHRYQQSYDVSQIDLYLDRGAFAAASGKAGELGNDFLSQYLCLQADLTNLGLLLRTRFLHSGRTYLELALFPGGSVAADRLLELYPAEPELIRAAYAGTKYAGLADLADTYGQPGTAGRFGLLADNLVIQHIRKARMIWRGPEVLLAYLIGREMEIKNIRIVLTCLRNQLPDGLARDLLRDSYLTWR